jgi:hypothetical protein
MKEQDYDTFTKNQNVSKNAVFRDTLTFKNDRPGDVFPRDGEAKNRG